MVIRTLKKSESERQSDPGKDLMNENKKGLSENYQTAFFLKNIYKLNKTG
jgi:hypothetical protein